MPWTVEKAGTGLAATGGEVERALEALQRLGKFPLSAMMLAAVASVWAQ